MIIGNRFTMDTVMDTEVDTCDREKGGTEGEKGERVKVRGGGSSVVQV